jgi:hypothetical protein
VRSEPQVPAPVVEEEPVAAPPRERTLCWAKGKPHIEPVPAPPAATGCRPFTEQLLLRAEARLRRETPITFQPSKLYIDVQCDPTTAVLEELVYEDGDATTGSLRIVQLREIENGDWTVRMIESVHAKDQRRLEIKGGTFKASELRTPVDAARISLHVRPNLVAIKNKQTRIRQDGSTGSRTYLRVTVEDVEGRVADRLYVGEPTTSSLHQRLPIIGAISAIDDALAKAKTKLAPVEETDEDRAMYRRRLALALALPPGEAWLKERYVNLATTLGTVDAIPLLVTLLDYDDSLRDSALEAVAAITGWNPRVAPDGTERSTIEAAAIASDECATSPSPST